MQGALRDTPSGFKKTIAGSFVFHVVAILLAALFFKMGAEKRIFTPVYSVSLVERAGPKKFAPARKASPPPKVKTKSVKTALKKTVRVKPKAKKTVKIKKKIAPVKKKVSVKAAVKKIEADVKKKNTSLVAASIAELARNQGDTEKVSAEMQRIRASIAARAASKNNGVGPGATGSTGGLTRKGLEEKYSAYYNTITELVQSNWEYPAKLNNEKLLVMVGLKIGSKGSLLDVRIEKGSGNERFDSSLINAVKKAAPFPPLPADYREEVLDIGFRFCPGCKD